MTAASPYSFAPDGHGTKELHLVAVENFESWLETQSRRVRTWIGATGFAAKLGDIALVPDPDGGLVSAVIGHGTARDRQRDRFLLGGCRRALPAARYKLHHALAPDALAEECLGWLLAGYSFRAGAPSPRPDIAELVVPDGADTAQLQILAAAEVFTRDLINTPAAALGPEELESAAMALATRFGADMSVTYGDDLLYQNLPLIHAVGRASDRAPRLLDMRWGQTGPKLTLVGKGVCFDTGGLNLKPGASMGLMKKDMGGAATVLGLAQMIMATGWPVQLRVLIPAVENAVSGSAMRPGDVLTSRKGLTIEVNNTDAEGRLVLADALALACEEQPDALICMATLTGAARVALGPDIAPFYTHDDGFAQRLMAASARMRDPLWQMPLYPGYQTMIEPGIADLDNAPSGGMAGSITAALFLERFVTDGTRFAHFDIYGYQPKPAPGRPKGGAAQGARALFAALPDVLGL
ncbi:MAG: leucyl aminopeptidase [Roseibaca calidilacus]|uniref:Leucyl aminopeptidase n=1 Tax=Roseibaca calidilacus TaxID=1666912 RepID=A0A0P7W3Q5_9RHOB|nr:leucyl aminopeptidase family protein [Roseibaca calidilacus]KPP91027.1 MAG: leucyl aminopeptidase [Roseibaca calidilacus]CUX83997.1 leucyl aminopeptidase [Roseibaca calidilacus]